MDTKKREVIISQALPIAGNDIDTDRIIPARFMKCITFDDLGQYAFYDERFTENGQKKPHPMNEDKFRDASILIVNKNFGCGSSREHAPQALMRYGFEAIIGESFAEIFAGNCNALGIPVLTLNENDITEIMETVHNKPESKLKINIQELTVILNEKQYQARIPESSRHALVTGTWDTTEILLGNLTEIKKVEQNLSYHFNN
jgi:3-isopropylmalate/(R)-2-methylmalate dehydratase small subunit